MHALRTADRGEAQEKRDDSEIYEVFVVCYRKHFPHFLRETNNTATHILSPMLLIVCLRKRASLARWGNLIIEEFKYFLKSNAVVFCSARLWAPLRPFIHD